MVATASTGIARPRRARTGLAIAVVSAVAVVVTAGCASASTSSTASPPAGSSASSAAAAQPASSSSGAIHFPATLFGLPHNTGASGQQIARGITHELAAIPLYTHLHLAVYGTGATSQLIILGISGLSAAAKKYGAKPSAAGMRRELLVMGITGARTFPAGKGTAQACGRMTRSGIPATFCMRYSKKKIVIALYLGTTASSLSDAAAKTSQALSASGG
jgi:hypothetical protein